MKITVLGCGGAGGVPTVSGGWGRCDPANPKNARLRSSLLVEQGSAALLIDTSPDLRQQLLNCGARRIDAVLYTHDHADHIGGIDELREINRAMRAPLNVYGSPETLRSLETRFAYAFEGIPEGQPIFRPWLVANPIAGDVIEAAGITVKTFLQDHGHATTLGFRIGAVAYSTDVWELPPAARAELKDLQVWFVGCLGDIPHPTHAHLDKVLGWIAELRPRRAIITHMGPTLDYDTLMSHLPVGVSLAFDGMQIEV